MRSSSGSGRRFIRCLAIEVIEVNVPTCGRKAVSPVRPHPALEWRSSNRRVPMWRAAPPEPGLCGMRIRRTGGAPGVRRAERGTALVFALSGAVQASWLARLPAVRDRLHLGLAVLGLALLATGAGSLLAMLGAGWLCRRTGSRRVAWVATALACAALVALGFAASGPRPAGVLF